MSKTRMAVSRRTLIALAVVDAVLFVIANATAKSSGSPGTVSNVAWFLFLLGFVTLIALGLTGAVRSRRAGA
jgi:hypothetical protein